MQWVSKHFFLLVLLLFLLRCGCDPMEFNDTKSNKVALFATRGATVPYVDSEYKVLGTPFFFFQTPLVVDVNGVLLALVLVRRKPPLKIALLDVSTEFYWYEEGYWPEGGDEDFLWRHEEGVDMKGISVDDVNNVSAVALAESSSFFFLESINVSNNTLFEAAYAGKWEPLLGVNDFDMSNNVSEPFTNITFKGSIGMICFNPELFFYSSDVGCFVGCAGTGIMTKDKILVFPVQVKNNEGQEVSLIMYAGHHDTAWKVSETTLPVNCIYPAVVEWKEKMLMMALCGDGYRKVFESIDMGNTWTEAAGSLSRVWGNTKKRNEANKNCGASSFITITIENNTMMLFTQLVEDSNDKYILGLWLTDNNRIYDVGRIVLYGERVKTSTLLFTRGKLFAVYTTIYKSHSSILLKRLVPELTLIKSVINSWNEMDRSISEGSFLYNDGTTAFCDFCAPPAMPITGLVGVLSDSGTASGSWFDNYLCVNASVRNANKVSNGFVFKGSSSGARWPVGIQGHSQRYNFVNRAFTLVATVVIHVLPRRCSSLLGLAWGENKEATRLALWYNKRSHWDVVYGATTVTSTDVWELNRPYQVVLSLHGGVFSLHVDGEVLLSVEKETVVKSGLGGVSHIFFASDYHGMMGSSKTHVTITNVFLYNRLVTARELRWPHSGPVKKVLKKEFSNLKICGGRQNDTEWNRNWLLAVRDSDVILLYKKMLYFFLLFLFLGVFGLLSATILWFCRKRSAVFRSIVLCLVPFF